MTKKVLIIGGVAGGASAATRLRRLSEDAEIIMVERGPHVSYANCGLPYYVGGEIAERGKLLVQTPEKLHGLFALDVRVNTEAVSIDRPARTVELRNTQTGEVTHETFTDLILSMGAAPLRPPIPGIGRAGHFSVRSVVDVDAITDWINTNSVKTAVVVGGGYIGLEMAEQLAHRGLQVSLVEALPQVMAPLDPEMAACLHAELRGYGVNLTLGDGVAGFETPVAGENAKASTVVLRSGKRLPGDIVILGLGVKSEIKLAAEAGLEIGARGGIRVDETMRTSDAHIFAVGDVAEVRDAVTGEWTLIPLAGPANRQGRIAADNICGLNSRYRSTQGSAVLRLFELTAATTGANEKTLKRVGMEYEAIHLHPASHAGYYPGASPISMKVLFNPKTGKFLGAQAVGKDGVDKRMDVFATALAAGMTMDDLAELELCYAPPFGSAKDPVNMAGMIAQNIMAGRLTMAYWDEISESGDCDFVLVDVRDCTGRNNGTIPGSIHIPLAELRGRMKELPRGQEIVVHCQSGQTSYFASQILQNNGYRVRNLSGSYLTWKTATGCS